MDETFTVTGGGSENKTFFEQVFSTSDVSKAEFMNTIQYSLYALLPVILLNAGVNRLIPEADTDSSSLILTLEIVIQIIVMFCAIIFIDRFIHYFKTWSGYKYQALNMTGSIQAFLIVVLSMQSKLGIKCHILIDRFGELWDGTPSTKTFKKKRTQQPADILPMSTPANFPQQNDVDFEPQAANLW